MYDTRARSSHPQCPAARDRARPVRRLQHIPGHADRWQDVPPQTCLTTLTGLFIYNNAPHGCKNRVLDIFPILLPEGVPDSRLQINLLHASGQHTMIPSPAKRYGGPSECPPPTR